MSGSIRPVCATCCTTLMKNSGSCCHLYKPVGDLALVKQLPSLECPHVLNQILRHHVAYSYVLHSGYLRFETRGEIASFRKCHHNAELEGCMAFV